MSFNSLVALNISAFVARAKIDGFSRLNRIAVRINPPAELARRFNTSSLTYYAESVNIPGVDLLTNELYLNGPTITYPQRSDYRPGTTMTFLVDDSMSQRLFFDAWMNYISPKERGFDLRYRDDYIGKITIFQIGETGLRTTYGVELYEAYPTSIGDIRGNWSEQEIVRQDVNFSYRYWRNLTEGEIFAGGILDDIAAVSGVDLPAQELEKVVVTGNRKSGTLESVIVTGTKIDYPVTIAEVAPPLEPPERPSYDLQEPAPPIEPPVQPQYIPPEPASPVEPPEQPEYVAQELAPSVEPPIQYDYGLLEPAPPSDPRDYDDWDLYPPEPAPLDPPEPAPVRNDNDKPYSPPMQWDPPEPADPPEDPPEPPPLEPVEPAPPFPQDDRYDDWDLYPPEPPPLDPPEPAPLPPPPPPFDPSQFNFGLSLGGAFTGNFGGFGSFSGIGLSGTGGYYYDNSGSTYQPVEIAPPPPYPPAPPPLEPVEIAPYPYSYGGLDLDPFEFTNIQLY